VSDRRRAALYGLAALVASLLWLGCKSDPPAVGGDGGGRDAAVIVDGPRPDGVPPGCDGPVAGAPQCSNCIDDDGDGLVDSFDVECTTPLDHIESSFRVGLPHEDLDRPYQDCFFDDNSGAGDDGCYIHVCCLLGAMTAADCPIGASQYDPGDCPAPIGTTPLVQPCADRCGALALPGCDCFGCCTLCDPVTNECHDIATHPTLSPGCTLQTISEPDLCARCTQVPSCGKPTCGGTTCILCPGQDPSDLPPSCNGIPACPAGTPSCATGETCPAGTYCHAGSGCCVGTIP
jgi:hypothetical protein